MEGTDICFAPVLSMAEAPNHPHMKQRGTFRDFEGTLQPAPAPRFGRTAPEIVRGPATPGEHNDPVLQGVLGYDSERIAKLKESGALG